MMYSNERDILCWFAKFQPEMTTRIGEMQYENTNIQCINARGRYTVLVDNTSYGYHLLIQIPISPQTTLFPIVVCEDERLYPALNRHILNNRVACLGTPLDIIARVKIPFEFATFAEQIINPFIIWQLYYDTFGREPPWGGRSHGVNGLIESYAEYYAPKWKTTANKVVSLLRGNEYNPIKPCICGSGRQFQYCHQEEIREIRQELNKLKVNSHEDNKTHHSHTLQRMTSQTSPNVYTTPRNISIQHLPLS